MLSSIRRALTPNASHAEDNPHPDLTLNTSPMTPNHSLRQSSPPPLSPTEASLGKHSIEGGSPWVAQPSKFNDSLMAAEQSLPMDLSPDQPSPNHEKGATNHSLLSPLRASDSTSKPYHRDFALDGASNDHLQRPSEGAHARGSPLPSVEPALSMSNYRRTPTPSNNHTGSGSSLSSPQKSYTPATENPHPRASPSPSPQPVRSTSEAQPVHKAPIQSENHRGLDTITNGTAYPSRMPTKKSHKTAPDSSRAGQLSMMSGALDIQPEQSTSANINDATEATSSRAQTSKRKREEDPAETETKPIQKQRKQPMEKGASTTGVEPQAALRDKSTRTRGGPKKDESSTDNVNQQDAASDETPKKRGRPKKEEGSTQSVKGKGAVKGGPSKKRGRPKKEEGSTHGVKSQRVSKGNTPAKRGRPKKDLASQTTKSEKSRQQNIPATETPKRRGRSAKEAEPTQVAELASDPTADAPKQKGRPKNGKAAAQGTDVEGASTRRMKRKAKTNEDTIEASEPQSSSTAAPAKKRGRTKATGQKGSAKTTTSGKRGRPKKK